MRKEEKNRAEGFVKLLERIHTGVREMLANKNLSVAMGLLGQCQSEAIRLGEMIEAREGKRTVTVSLLEQYCELVYRLYEEIQQGLVVEGDKAYNVLAKQLIQIGNSIHKDIPIHTEVVFLPYKASMWDSLESIWKAAHKEPNCEDYVIPIPYYDKNPDGSLGEMHNEADQYPADVPITDYQTYDFATRHPDVIFIHNPYDNCNYVTSVPPFFYSKNLRRFTDTLVYIPYFILSEIDPDDSQDLKGMSHFCMVPGVINADKVIVQSKAMRQAYINVLVDGIGEKYRKLWEDKILGLGSPKVDKVLETKKEDLKLPVEWKRVIQNPDGNWKKIILYNTSVNMLLLHKERMMNKMKTVFLFFKEIQNHVALIWRPHPLTEATIKAMCPQLEEEYKKIVAWYRGEKWGIYDDSADLVRALTLCDGYYGDASSLVHLCKKAGKPIMIQNVEMP